MIVTVLVSAIVSAIISIVVYKAIAAYHFEVTDSYVKDVVKMAKDEIEKAYLNRDKH